jgi:hypothetical protein
MTVVLLRFIISTVRMEAGSLPSQPNRQHQRSFHARRGLAVFGVPPLRSRNSVRGTAVVFEHGLL